MKIGIVGAGNMGSGIAQKYASEGLQTVVFDLNQEAVNKGRDRIEATLKEGVGRRIFKPEQAQQILERLLFTIHTNDLKDCDLIIEAVFEDIEVKKQLFKQLDQTCDAKTLLATNTSSFYVRDLASATTRPDRFVGLHYFYHPAKNRLVEVIRGDHTSEATFQTAWQIQESIGKIPIESKDSPGFIVNRFFVPWLNESMRIVDEGLANIATVEAAAKQAFQIGMGPFELMNVTGVPITFHAATTLAKELGDFYTPCKLIVPIIEQKRSWDLKGEINTSQFDLISSRLLSTVFTIAKQMVLVEKVCSVEDCDLGARVGLRWAKGPFELAGETPQFVQSSVDGDIGTIVFNRPDSLNALNETTIKQLRHHFELLNANSNLKGIIIKGRGKAFVAGADTHFFVEQIQKNNIERIVCFAKDAQNLFLDIDQSSKTIVCCIDGLALGGGLELALACDYIIGSPKAKVGFPETGIGIYPGLGGTQRTPRRIGLARAKHMILSGEIMGAEKSKQIGLFDDVVPSTDLHQRAVDIVNALPANFPSKAPLALKSVEELINMSITHSLVDGLTAESNNLEHIFSTKDALIGLLSIGKQKPVFTGK